MDWGLAKQTTGAQRPEGRVETALDSRPRDPLRGFETMNGVVVGTPPYVSPEQARGELEAIDVRSDIYVLGAILYAILSLRATVMADSMEALLEQITTGRIDEPRSFNRTARRFWRRKKNRSPRIALPHCPSQRIPDGLSAVAMKALRLQPAERYQTVEEMQSDLTAYQGGFAPLAERAGFWRRMMLFASRHRREFSLFVGFALIVQLLLVLFILVLNREKNLAIHNANRAEASERELSAAVNELAGTAPTYAAEAADLLDKQKLDEALEKIDYAVDQVPNDPNYRALRGNILQSMLRFSESSLSYEEALRRNPGLRSAKENLALNTKLVGKIGDDGQVTPAILRELHASLISQKRVGEALAVLDAIGRDKKLFFDTWRTAFEKRGLRQRFETKEDGTLLVDLSKIQMPDLRKLRGAPVSGIDLDDTRTSELSALKGLSLKSLSLNYTPVRDLSPLLGMPLNSLNLESTLVTDLRALSRMPLEILRLQGTRVDDLKPLHGLKLEQLNLAGCHLVTDLAPLAGMPLQKLDLSRTGISDLTPLVQSPLRELILDGCTDLTDLHPLMEIKTLETVLIPAHCHDIEFLRDHPGIKRLSYKKLTEPVYEFWDEFDKRQGKKTDS
jgi:serine/threonine protein kinase